MLEYDMEVNGCLRHRTIQGSGPLFEKQKEEVSPSGNEIVRKGKHKDFLAI
jgi:hypothetical protein